MSLELVAYAVCVGVVSFTKAILLSSMNFIRFLPLEFELRHPKVFDLMFLGSYCTLDVDIYYCEHCAVSMYPVSVDIMSGVMCFLEILISSSKQSFHDMGLGNLLS
ncbi:uncharacterized protein LOC143243129 isoform X2 [Tachypleus tridentatus]|uniref:uncharacterized protein LOC143243109 isoform X2 n=1 Tax=Tachypleus tridentatus TaxID=6853 RepID=UPI003FD0D111